MSTDRLEPAPADPFELARLWLPANDHPERPQVTLATTDADGAPDARTVLLSSFDDDGFSFHTDAASRKAAELRADPRAAIVVLWPGFTRQLVIRGDAAPAPDDEVAAAYRARSPYLRQLAWQNTHEHAALPLDERRAAWAEFAAERPDPPQPVGWAGFRLRPRVMTFWVSGSDTASRRLEYTRTDGAWAHRHLAG